MIRWVTVFLDRPADTFGAALDFWCAVTQASASPVRGEHGEFLTLVPADGDAHLRMQRVAGGADGSHLDMHVGDVGVAADRALELGAAVVAHHGGLVVMQSVGGLPFCIVGHHGESVRPPPIGVPGVRIRVDQVCIDIAPDRFDDECRFWAELTGWHLRAGIEPEYAVLDRADGQPFRFLLQRRGDDDVGLPTECHLDLACDDIARSVDDHVRLGAELVARFPRWTVMADPADVRYCLTRRNPDTGVGS